MLLLGSGVPSFHNFEVFSWDVRKREKARIDSLAFEGWLQDTLGNKALTTDEQLTRLEAWGSAPGARLCHPVGCAEHFMPTLVLAGAALQHEGASCRAVLPETHPDILGLQPQFACQHYEFS